MIWKVRAVEARPTDDENEYEFTAPIVGSDGHDIQILDFSPEMEFNPTVTIPATVIYAYPDRSE